MNTSPDPRQIAAELIRRQTGHIGRSAIRTRILALHQEAGIPGLPDEALITTVHDLIGTAEITWPEATS